MEKMRLYLVITGTYNRGNPVGDRFTCPIYYDEMAECLKPKGNHEEYAVHDYTLSFDIDIPYWRNRTAVLYGRGIYQHTSLEHGADV